VKVGDVVKVWRINRWGGKIPTEKLGIVLKRTVLAYESKNSYWKVLINGKIQKIKESSLQSVSR